MRNFGNGKKHQLNVFDKQTGKVFVTNAKNVACEGRFYDFEIEGKTYTIKSRLSEIENKAKPLFRRLIDADSATILSSEERGWLSIFFAIQFVRTRTFREQWRDLPRLFGLWLRGSVIRPEQLEAVEEYFRVPDENQTKMEASQFITHAYKEFAPHFASKIWLLLHTDRKSPFMIGDNPLTLQNSIDMGPRGNLGLAVRGIEIYFPLSPTRALALWCLSHEETIRKAVQDLRHLTQVAPEAVAAGIRSPSTIEDTYTAINTGRPLKYLPENVMNFNSLQIAYAERLVFSSANDFALASKMIEDHPDLRMGPRVRIG